MSKDSYCVEIEEDKGMKVEEDKSAKDTYGVEVEEHKTATVLQELRGEEWMGMGVWGWTRGAEDGEYRPTKA